MSDTNNLVQRIVTAIELHDVDGIKNCFRQGVEPNMIYNGVPLIYELTSEYARTGRFSDCVRAFLEHGLVFPDKLLLSVLLNDDNALKQILTARPSVISNTYTLRCAYTPLREVTLLHICAEYNHVDCAKVLVGFGADVDAPAGKDEHGFGGQTPVFHTVNQNSNHSADMLDFLLSKKASLDLTVKGLIWGQTYPWETFIPAVNPISYAMMGLLPQMHRDEKVISSVISKLFTHAYDMQYALPNVPNAYLVKR